MKLNLLLNNKTSYVQKDFKYSSNSKKNINYSNKYIMEQTDNITISDEALELQEKINDEKKKLEEEIKKMKEEAKKSKEEMEAAAKMWQTITKCFKIALRIIMDDKVPMTDEKFLMKNDDALYNKSILLRNNMKSIKNSDDRKNYNSILSKDDIKDLEVNINILQSDNKEISKIETNDLLLP